MYARIITFRLDGLTPDEYRDRAAAIAPAFTEWPGLLAKVWIADVEAGTYGGIYIFADRASADRSRETDLFRGLAANPPFAEVAVREFEVVEEATAITAAVFAAAHTG